ncbi:MAG: hypothetical protein PVJ69_12580 [Desulfobacteraceae bacterium]|jgi:DNA-directed RNA polymerase subunit RPC12/RpoP
MATQQNFSVLEVLGEVESLLYRCPECGERIEVLADEVNKKHVCPKCGKQIDFMKRPHSLYGKEDLQPVVDNHPKASRLA